MNIPKLEKPYHYDGGNYFKNSKEYQKIIKKFINNKKTEE